MSMKRPHGNATIDPCPFFFLVFFFSACIHLIPTVAGGSSTENIKEAEFHPPVMKELDWKRWKHGNTERFDSL